MQTVIISHNNALPTPLKLRELLNGRPDQPAMVELDRAESYLAHASASRLLVVLSPMPDRAMQVLRKVRGLINGPVLAVGPVNNPRLILQALNFGANHYVDEADLDGQFETLLARLNPREESAAVHTGRLIAVLGAGGGSGTSTVACNLAAVLARDARRCALLDLHPGAGDQAALLDLKPTHTLADLCMKASAMDQAMVESSLVGHPSGISLLAPPDRYDEIPLVTPHGVQKVLTLLRQLYPFTVADLEDCFHEEQVIALRQADNVLVVLRPDYTSLRNARRLLAHFDQVGIARGRLRLVLNRCGQAKELPAEEIEQALGMPIGDQLPDDARTVNGANNTGILAVLKAAGSKVSQAIVELAHAINPPADPKPPSGPARRASWLSFR
ncbi:MAG: AAA family ATPase [Gemmataceae bacterium]